MPSKTRLKNTCLSVDCDEEMKQRIVAFAEKHKMTISQYVRMALDGGALETLDGKLTKLRVAAPKQG